MTLSRKTGLLLGFGTGLIIAAIVFGVFWFMNSREKAALVKTQVQTQQPKKQPITAPGAETSPAATSGEINPEDNLLQRLAPSEKEVIQDIQKSMNELFGGTTPAPTPASAPES